METRFHASIKLSILTRFLKSETVIIELLLAHHSTETSAVSAHFLILMMR